MLTDRTTAAALTHQAINYLSAMVSHSSKIGGSSIAETCRKSIVG